MKEPTTLKFPTALAACTAIAVDLAERVFQVAGEDALGTVIYEERIKSREAFAAFLRGLPAGLTVLMESGPDAQAWAYQLNGQCNTVRILPAQRVAEHRGGAKNDRHDAHAILRAGRDGDVFAVPRKSAQALHRIRESYVRRRTALGLQMRGLLQEHDMALAQGDDAALMRGVPLIVEDASHPAPELLRELLAGLLVEWEHMGRRIQALTARLQEQARQDARARQRMSVRGTGPIIATANIARQTKPERSANAHKFFAYFVPTALAPYPLSAVADRKCG